MGLFKSKEIVPRPIVWLRCGMWIPCEKVNRLKFCGCWKSQSVTKIVVMVHGIDTRFEATWTFEEHAKTACAKFLEKWSETRLELYGMRVKQLNGGWYYKEVFDHEYKERMEVDARAKNKIKENARAVQEANDTTEEEDPENAALQALVKSFGFEKSYAQSK